MNILLILLAITLTALLVRCLLRAVAADSPSHADWNVESLPSSAYALRHEA